MTEQAPPAGIMERIQKLLNLAARNPNEAEAASATSKAQELLAEHNLSADALGGMDFSSGARQKDAIEGGFFKFEQELWEEVAQLNFCLYWHQRYLNRSGKNKYGDTRIWGYRHCLVGRAVNVAATKAISTYLISVSNRLTKDSTRGANTGHGFSNWGNSYRRGIVARICRKLREKRNKALVEEEARAADLRRASDQPSSATAVSLLVYIDKETDANIDFLHGEGTAAAWAAERVARAAAQREAQAAYTIWAAEHPEEARAESEKRQKQLRRSRGRGGSTDNIDNSAYWRGYDAGAGVSIDQQVGESARPTGLLG